MAESIRKNPLSSLSSCPVPGPRSREALSAFEGGAGICVTTNKTVRIGGASAFIFDTSVSTPQLVEKGDLDYLVYDYLAEVTMSILTYAKARNPERGYATKFVEVDMRDNLREIASRGIKVIANAGGVNCRACRDALLAVAGEEGVDIKVAVVEGDDLTARSGEFKKRGVREMFSGAPWPEGVGSIDAYLGARPIAEALGMGADVVITGRVVDSALVLGPLLHEFGWADEDYDLLSAGSLAGHIIECGAQATGGLHTDWERVPDWAHIGYPVIECHTDGSFVVSKPPDTGGLVTPATVAEQLHYELGDPQAYFLPDVTCDFTEVGIEQTGDHEVRVSGAVGRPPTDTYKVCVVYHDGYRSVGLMPVIGIDAARKAERQARAVLERTREIFREKGLGDYTAASIEPLGAEASYGANSRARHTREVACVIAVSHPQPEALEIFARELSPPVISMSPGSTGWIGGMARAVPILKLFSFLIPKEEVPVTVTLGPETRQVHVSTVGGFDPAAIVRPKVPEVDAVRGETVAVPLVRLAWGRSGDKGDSFNIGVIARRPEYLPYIRAALTEESVKSYFAHVFEGARNPRVERFDLPALHSLNFVLHESLGGGGMASLRTDPLGKGMAQQLLDFPVPVPAALAQKEGLTSSG